MLFEGLDCTLSALDLSLSSLYFCSALSIINSAMLSLRELTLQIWEHSCSAHPYWLCGVFIRHDMTEQQRCQGGINYGNPFGPLISLPIKCKDKEKEGRKMELIKIPGYLNFNHWTIQVKRFSKTINNGTDCIRYICHRKFKWRICSMIFTARLCDLTVICNE